MAVIILRYSRTDFLQNIDIMFFVEKLFLYQFLSIYEKHCFIFDVIDD